MSYLDEPASIVFEPGPEAASEARSFALERAGGLLDGARRDNFELLVSELVTNAVIHAGTACRMMLCRHGHQIRVELEDESPDLPRLRPHADEHGGWGLRLLTKLAHEWGTERLPHGKCVWFLI